MVLWANWLGTCHHNSFLQVPKPVRYERGDEEEDCLSNRRYARHCSSVRRELGGVLHHVRASSMFTRNSPMVSPSCPPSWFSIPRLMTVEGTCGGNPLSQTGPSRVPHISQQTQEARTLMTRNRDRLIGRQHSKHLSSPLAPPGIFHPQNPHEQIARYHRLVRFI